MNTEMTAEQLRKRLSPTLERICDDQEVVIVHRRGAKDFAMLPADEWSRLVETANLLRPRRNSQRALGATTGATSRAVKVKSVSLLASSKYAKR